MLIERNTEVKTKVKPSFLENSILMETHATVNPRLIERDGGQGEVMKAKLRRFIQDIFEAIIFCLID